MSVEGSTPEVAEITIRNSVFFDADFYLGTYPDVASSGLDPAMHYLLHGALEGEIPGLTFQRKK
jgi:O-antigen biosynthesis protein